MSLDLYIRYRDSEPCECCGRGGEVVEVGWFNCTHNLAPMAKEARIYKPLWWPREAGILKAGDLVPVLGDGLRELRSDPSRFRKHNPPNGWGDYDGFVRFVGDVLECCAEHPDAEVEVSV